MNGVSFNMQQECIPVGCVPPTLVATTRCQYQGVYRLRRGVPSGGPTFQGCVPSVGGGVPGIPTQTKKDLGQGIYTRRSDLGPGMDTSPVYRMTDRH